MRWMDDGDRSVLCGLGGESCSPPERAWEMRGTWTHASVFSLLCLRPRPCLTARMLFFFRLPLGRTMSRCRHLLPICVRNNGETLVLVAFYDNKIFIFLYFRRPQGHKAKAGS